MRETGFYWVKPKSDDWEIAYYETDDGWYMVHCNDSSFESYKDNEFLEIDEKIIKKK